MSQKPRLVYAGTPDFAAEALTALINAGHDIIAVYTQPDRPSGRGRKLTPSPVKAVALEHNIEVFQPVNFKEDGAIETLANLKPDLMIVAAYGLILPQAVLDIPENGCINIHGSLLPRWRGAAPIQRAIQAGDQETGITIMQMDVGLDTGDMLTKKSVPITDSDTGGSLHDKLAKLGAEAIVEFMELQANGEITATQQDDTQANYAHKLSKEESSINWEDDAESIARCVRAFNPWPVSYTSENGERVRILEAEAIPADKDKSPGTIIEKTKNGIVVACRQGALRISRLQLPGSKALTAAEFVNGGKQVLMPDTVLGN